MAGCEGWVYAKGKQGSPLRGRPCGMRAVVKVPEGLDLRAGVWLCAYHAPAKLLPSTVAERKTPNDGANRTAAGGSGG